MKFKWHILIGLQIFRVQANTRVVGAHVLIRC